MDSINPINSGFLIKAWLQQANPKQPVSDVEVNQFLKNLVTGPFNLLMQQDQAAAKRNEKRFKDVLEP